MELISKLKKSNTTQVDKKLPPELLESECKCDLIATDILQKRNNYKWTAINTDYEPNME